MKYIVLKLDDKNIKPNSEIKGHVTVNYPGKYDGIVINTLIVGSSKLIVYKSYNNKQISDNVSRLFVSKDLMPDNKVEFTAVIEFEPKQTHDVKFRASIIEQHKEVGNIQTGFPSAGRYPLIALISAIMVFGSEDAIILSNSPIDRSMG